MVSFIVLVLALLACNQNNELNSIDIPTEVGRYRIILPENKGFEIDTFKFGYKSDFEGVIRWVIIKNNYHNLYCTIFYNFKRNESNGKKLDIYDSFLFGDKPGRGIYAVLDKEIDSNKEFDFYTTSFVSFATLKNDLIDYSQRKLHVSLNYVFKDINFSFKYNKKEYSETYWEILKDIKLIKKIRVIKISN